MNENKDVKNWREKIDELETIIKSKTEERNDIKLHLSKQEDEKLRLRYDEIGYDLIDEIANKNLFEIMDNLLKQKRTGLILRIENYGDRKNNTRQKINKMIKLFKGLNLPNRIFFYNKLITIFDDWYYFFQNYGNLPEMRECYYAKMKARMCCNWFLIWG